MSVTENIRSCKEGRESGDWHRGTALGIGDVTAIHDLPEHIPEVLPRLRAKAKTAFNRKKKILARAV